MSNADTLKILKDLIQTSEEYNSDLEEAASAATRAELKVFFHVRSVDCGSAVVELQRLVESIGGTPNSSVAINGAILCNRIKTVPANSDFNVAALEEIERVENKTNAIYAKALTAELPYQILSVVQRQYEHAVRNHDLIRDLRSSYHIGRHPPATSQAQ